MNFENPVIRILGYVVFSLVVFVTALLITFPDAQIKEIAAVQIESRFEKAWRTNLEVEVGDVDLWWLLGAELENVRIREKSAADAAAQSSKNSEGGPSGKARKSKQKRKQRPNGETPVDLEIPIIAARLAPISSILNGGLAVKYHLGLGGGSITGSYMRGGQGHQVTTSFNSVNLAETELLENYTGVPFSGILTGRSDLTFAASRPVLTAGEINLAVDRLKIGPKKEVKFSALPMGYMKVPRTNLGQLRIKMHVEGGGGRPTLKIDRFDFGGQSSQQQNKTVSHIQSQVWGSIQLANSFARADARLRMRMRFNPGFLKKNQLTSILRIPEFRNGKKGNWYGFVLWGKMGSPNFKGAPGAADGPKKEGAAAKPPSGQPPTPGR